MNVDPMGGLPAAAAGTPLAQSSGSEIKRAHQESSARQRRIQTDAKAEAASGIAAPDGEENQSEERDADGRRLWEAPEDKNQQSESEPQDQDHSPQTKDAGRQSGKRLDLTG